MNMKGHILAAMREQFEAWKELLGRISEEQITAPQFDLDWSVKDVLAHLWGWQQISLARMEGGLNDREPLLPQWVIELGTIWEESADQTNARIYDLNHEKVWTDVYGNWKSGYQRLIDAGYQISERDLLDSDRFNWLNGYSLAFVLVASYEHHQEHYEKLTDWIKSDEG